MKYKMLGLITHFLSSKLIYVFPEFIQVLLSGYRSTLNIERCGMHYVTQRLLYALQLFQVGQPRLFYLPPGGQ